MVSSVLPLRPLALLSDKFNHKIGVKLSGRGWSIDLSVQYRYWVGFHSGANVRWTDVEQSEAPANITCLFYLR